MTNPMLAELDAVVRLAEKATPGPWLYRPKSNSWHKPPPEGTNYSYGEFILGMDSDSEDDGNGHDEAFLIAAVQFMSTHHAPLADMAKRMEMEAGFLKVAETTLYQIATTPRNAGARRNASATMRFIETQRAAAIDATQEGEG